MAHYLVRFSRGANNKYVYPKSMEGVVWKTTVYHHTERVMVGETDAKIKADGKKVIALTPAEAKKQIKRLQSSFPALQDLPGPMKFARSPKK